MACSCSLFKKTFLTDLDTPNLGIDSLHQTNGNLSLTIMVIVLVETVLIAISTTIRTIEDQTHLNTIINTITIEIRVHRGIKGRITSVKTLMTGKLVWLSLKRLSRSVKSFRPIPDMIDRHNNSQDDYNHNFYEQFSLFESTPRYGERGNLLFQVKTDILCKTSSV